MTSERVLAAGAGLLALAGPRRTRPLAGVLFGVFLSRAHGAVLRTVHEGALAAARRGGAAHDEHRARLDDLERAIATTTSLLIWQVPGARDRISRAAHIDRIDARIAGEVPPS